MPLEMPEEDWKRLREFYKLGLERFCKRVLQDVEQLNAGTPLSYHQRYLDLYKLIESRDETLGSIFNDNLMRSRAIELAIMLREESLMFDDEFSQLTPPTREKLNYLLSRRMA